MSAILKTLIPELINRFEIGFVDDYVDSFETHEEAKVIVEQVNYIQNSTYFKLRGFVYK